MLNARQGASLTGWRCENCGGLYLRHFDINRVDKNAVSDLYKLPINPDRDAKIDAGGHRCPECFAPFKQLLAESIPRDVYAEACPKCGANWFPYGSLLKFKEAQLAKLAYFKLWNIPLGSAAQILIPVLTLAILSGGSVYFSLKITQYNSNLTRAASIIGKPIVTAEAADNVRIYFVTTIKTTSVLEISGVEIKTIRLAVSPTSETYHTITLKQLKHGSKYQYRLIVKDETGAATASPYYSFTL